MGRQIELLPFLSGIVKQTATHYAEDFKIDTIRLNEAIFKSRLESRTFLWMARPLGTQLVLERNVFLKETDDHRIWTHYADMSEGIQAYRVVVQGGNREGPLGTVRKLNYPEQVKRVMANALHAERIEFTYPSGERRGIAIEKYRQEREWLFTSTVCPATPFIVPMTKMSCNAYWRRNNSARKNGRLRQKRSRPKVRRENRSDSWRSEVFTEYMALKTN